MQQSAVHASSLHRNIRGKYTICCLRDSQHRCPSYAPATVQTMADAAVGGFQQKPLKAAKRDANSNVGGNPPATNQTEWSIEIHAAPLIASLSSRDTAKTSES